ncbi:MAG: scramblase, partial [Actinobacteria bacterium]|nr:scramblase [Actinomycetota bacterium]
RGSPHRMSDLLNRERLIIQQKGKLIELTQEFKIRDEEGNEIGVIKQEGQSLLKKALRLVGSFDQFFTHTLSVYDAADTKVLQLTRPRKIFKSKILVEDGSGKAVGQILQQNVFGKIRFDLVGSGGEKLGQIRAENWRAWNFALVDAEEKEFARITKKWAGLAKALFTQSDNYVLEIQPSVSGDLRLLALASAAGVDTALKQDARGLNA